MKNLRVVLVVKTDEYESDFPPTNLMEFRAWLDQKTNLIPEQYRHNAEFEIDSYVSYDSSYARLTIQYSRPELPEEESARESELMRRKRANLDEARARYEKLKADIEGAK